MVKTEAKRWATAVIHGLSRYQRGCRCDVCRSANSKNKQARRRSAFLAGSEIGGTYRHGTRYAYELRGCRCDVCTAGNLDRRRVRIGYPAVHVVVTCPVCGRDVSGRLVDGKVRLRKHRHTPAVKERCIGEWVSHG